MKKKYIIPFLSLACIIHTVALGATQNVTIKFTLNNLTLAEVERFNTYISYNEAMDPQTLLTDCTEPTADSVSPYTITCPDVNIEQFPVYFKVAPVVANAEITYDTQEVADPAPAPVQVSMVQGFKLEMRPPSPDSDPSPDGTVFYWSMETLPASSTTSDIGNVTISKHLNAGVSSPGVKGNGFEQTGVWQTYKFPMQTLPTKKGTYEFWMKHDISSAANDSQPRYLFRSSNTGQANTIYAWQNLSTTWFYIVDSTGTTHRVFNQSDSWEAGVWYLYEFIWDTTTGYLSIKRDGNIIAEQIENPWNQNTPNWGDQDMYIGYDYRIGMFDEFIITY